MTKRIKILSCLSICIFAMAPLINQASASEIISTNEYQNQIQIDISKQHLQEQLSNKELREALVAHGVSPEKAAERIARLTPAEANELAAKIEQLPAAGSEVTVLLLVIIIVLLLGMN